MENDKLTEQHIKLYSLLVDQLQKYNSIIWQAPTALFAANILALDKYSSEPVVMLLLSIFNLGLVYAFDRMITQQRRIIESSQKVEDLIKQNYINFIPEFSKTKVPAPIVLVAILYLLDLILFIYSITQFV